MKRGLIIIMASFIVLTSACENNKPKEFTWTNPVTYSSEGGKGLRDPFILKEADIWYITGTMYPYGLQKENKDNIKTPGVPLYKSNDLKTWEFVGIMINSPENTDKDKWYQDRFWAPEIFHHNGKFYLTVNCCALDGSGHGMLFAESENIEGPYNVMNESKPAFYGNDAHLFVDDDGKTYLYGSDIWGVQIDLSNLKTTGTRKNPIKPISGSDEWNGKREGVGIEGPYVLKRNNTYFMFYSTWSRGYEVGIAYSDDPLKNWVMESNPLYGSINQGSCNYYGGIYEEYYTNQDKYREVGHNSIFLGPDGCDWIVAHAYDYEKGEVKYVMDRIEFNEDKTVKIVNVNSNEKLVGPSFGKQTLVFNSTKSSSPVKVLDVWGKAIKGKEYRLPNQVDILFDNGWRECCPVIWDSEVNTDETGETEKKGKATYEGISYECKAIIKISDEYDKR